MLLFSTLLGSPLTSRRPRSILASAMPARASTVAPSARLAHAAKRRTAALRRVGVLTLLLGALTSLRLEAFGWPSEVQRLGRALGSPRSSERVDAAHRLLRLPPGSARPLVELALEDEDDLVRLAAARAAVAHGFLGLGEQVAGWLAEPLPALRTAALRVLALDLALEQVPAVIRAAQDADEGVRASAVRCLGRARLALAREVGSALTAALDDSSPLVRLEAATALGRIGEAGAVSALIARATDPEEGVRRAVIVALGALGEPKATAALTFALADRSTTVGALAARALGSLGDVSAAGALERVVLEPGWGPLPLAAAQALADLDAKRGWDAIIQRLAEADVAPALRPLFAQPTPNARESIAACLEQSGGAPLLECARVAARIGLPLDALASRVRRGGLPLVKLLQAVERTEDVELLVLAVERLARGSVAERRAALDLLEQSAPLPAATGRLLGEALTVPGLGAADVARLLFLLAPADVPPQLSSELQRASDPTVRASARALAALARVETGPILAPFEGSATESKVYGRLLARGMSPRVAERLLSELARRKAPLSAAMLTALSGLPPDLPEASVRKLGALATTERGVARERLLALVAAQRRGSTFFEAFLGHASVQERRSVSALFSRYPSLGGLASGALSDSDPWVRAHAAQGARRAELDQVARLTVASEPAFVRTAALLGLAHLDATRAAASVAPCDLLDAPQLGVRLGALELVARAGVSCPKVALEDLVLLEREPALREAAARALRLRQPGHRALRSCQAYDPEAHVAVACGARPETPTPEGEPRLEFVDVIPPWLDEPAPGCPYALLDATGRITVGVTDQLGRAPAWGGGIARLLDPRIAL